MTAQPQPQPQLTLFPINENRCTPQQLMFQEVADCLFEGYAGSTKQRKRIGGLAAELLANGASPGSVQVRRDRYLRDWAEMRFTPEALVKHWSRFAFDRQAGPPGVVRAKPGKYANLNLA